MSGLHREGLRRTGYLFLVWYARERFKRIAELPPRALSPAPNCRGEKTSDFIQDIFGVIQNLVVGEPQYAQSLRDHVRVAVLIVMPLFAWIMH
jgi:hypothetical protein